MLKKYITLDQINEMLLQKGTIGDDKIFLRFCDTQEIKD